MTCEAHDCTATATVHVLYRAVGHADKAEVCRLCLLSVLTGNARAHGQRAAHVADHPLEPQCSHPSAVWVEDRCEIPGLELLDMSDLDEKVPA